MTVRPLRTEDVSKVLELWNAYSVEVAQHPLSEQERRDIGVTLVRYVKHPEAFGWVATDGTRLLGFCTTCVLKHPILPGNAGEIEELYVAPEARQRGVGRRLLEASTQELSQRGAQTLRVPCDAPNARAFLERCGWEASTTFTRQLHLTLA